MSRNTSGWWIVAHSCTATESIQSRPHPGAHGVLCHMRSQRCVAIWSNTLRVAPFIRASLAVGQMRIAYRRNMRGYYISLWVKGITEPVVVLNSLSNMSFIVSKRRLKHQTIPFFSMRNLEFQCDESIVKFDTRSLNTSHSHRNYSKSLIFVGCLKPQITSVLCCTIYSWPDGMKFTT